MSLLLYLNLCQVSEISPLPNRREAKAKEGQTLLVFCQESCIRGERCS